MPEIHMDKVSYEYPNQLRALNRVELMVEKGEFVAVMGPNGAGKSTLCLTLNGIAPQSLGGTLYGSVRVCGLDTLQHHVYELAQHVGIVMQNPEAQLLCSTVEDELAFGPENLCVPVAEIRERIGKTAVAVRILDLLERAPSDLSGGQIQRVATAAMLAMQPEIMVFDEATSALDPRGTLELFQLVRELNAERRMTIVMTEHKSEQLAELADKIAILDKGVVVDVGSPREVFSQVERLEQYKVAPPQVTRLMHDLGFPAEALPITLDEAEVMIRARLAAQSDRRAIEKTVALGDPETPATATSGEAVIEAKGVSFSYHQRIEALRNVTLTINKGEFVGIIGENGAGKSTLVKHFVGLLKPSEGEIRLFGQPSENVTTSSLAGRIGLILQNPDHQLFKSSVVDEVKVGPMRLGVQDDQLEARANEAMQLVGIAEMRDAHPLSLSWGDRQRVALASVLAMKPEVIIFDEPTTGQDWQGRRIFMELGKDLIKQGFTIICITHDMELITRYAKRCIVMAGGQVLLDGPTREVFRHPEVLSQAFIEPPQIVQLAHRLADCGVEGGILTVEDMARALRQGGVGS